LSSSGPENTAVLGQRSSSRRPSVAHPASSSETRSDIRQFIYLKKRGKGKEEKNKKKDGGIYLEKNIEANV